MNQQKSIEQLSRSGGDQSNSGKCYQNYEKQQTFEMISQEIDQSLLDSSIQDDDPYDFYGASFSTLEVYVDPEESQNSISKFTLRVINSTFIYSSLLLPYFFYTTGVILTFILFIFLFGISYYSCKILLKLKYYAKLRNQMGTMQALIQLLKINPLVLFVFRTIYILNALLYLILLQIIFGITIAACISLSQNDQQGLKIYEDPRIYTGIGTLFLFPFVIWGDKKTFLSAIGRIIGFIALIFAVFTGFIEAALNNQIEQSNYFYPLIKDFSILECLSASSTIVLSFAYHQQFFTTSFRVTDEEYKMSMGSFQGSVIIILFDLIIAILGGITFQQEIPNNKQGFDLITIYVQATFIRNYLKYLFLIPIAISVWIQMNQYSFQIFKQSKSKRAQSIILQLVALTFSGCMAILEPPIFLPLILMGSLTQLFLSFVIPSVLYQRLLMLEDKSKTFESIINFIFIFIELAFGFLCLLSDIFLTTRYYRL